MAPQVTEGLLLKAVNGTDVVNWATNDVMGLMAARPLSLRFVRLHNGGGGGGGADPAVLMKLQLELSQTKEHLQTVEADGSRMLEHMYHLEDELERSRAEHKQSSADLEAASRVAMARPAHLNSELRSLKDALAASEVAKAEAESRLRDATKNATAIEVQMRGSNERAARLQTMAAEMALRREISHARGHKRKVRAEEEEDTPEGLRHLKKAEPQFKWKKERKR